MRWKVLWTIGLGVSLWAGVLVHTQTPSKAPAKAMVLTAADYIEIQQLAVRSSYAIDSGASGCEQFADLFAPGGAFISASRGRIEGRENLVALGRGRNPMIRDASLSTTLSARTAPPAGARAGSTSTDGKVGGQLTSTGGRYGRERRRHRLAFKSRKFVRRSGAGHAGDPRAG